jgi:hypothetical protein
LLSSLMETGQSFTARRPAASNLPNFQLPPPDLSALNKYPAYAATSSAAQATPPITGHVLTPPAGLSGDVLSPLGSSVSSSSQSSAGGIAPYQPNGFWPSSQNPSYSYSAAPSMPAPFAQQQQQHQQQQQNYISRPMYSPGMSFPNRSTSSPTGGLPPPPYDLSLPPFPTSMSSSGGSHQNLPNLAPHQRGQTSPIGNGILSSQAPPRPSLSTDPYGGRPPSSHTYYSTPSSTPQQSSFSAYSPTQQSPNHSQAPRLSPVSAHHPSMNGYNRPYNGYSLPAMAGPIMSNVHNPGNQMALVGGMSMQYPHQMGGQHMYGHQQQQHQQQQNDRPFKCNQCTQGFNRNHDLKRHQRIHLAVKPFPCGHCEKSFSRKDALKVRSLVRF